MLCMKISCHKHNLKPFLTDYIYRISYKIAKKGKPPKKDLPFLILVLTPIDLQNRNYIHICSNFLLQYRVSACSKIFDIENHFSFIMTLPKSLIQCRQTATVKGTKFKKRGIYHGTKTSKNT